VAASAALALVLLAPGTSSAQVRFAYPYFGGYRGFGYGYGIPSYYNPYYGNGYGYGMGYSPYANPYGYGTGYGPYANPYGPPAYNPYAYSPPAANPQQANPNTTNYPPAAAPQNPPATARDTGRPAMRDSFYPPSKTTTDAPATVVVQLPADAELWFQGQKTDLKGAERTFTSPPLERGASYTYDVKARWTEDGQPVEKAQSIKVRAGERTTVKFGNQKD
jgi:uncharacterized protein (TIGR03000 family)